MHAMIFPGQGSQAVGMGQELYRQSATARAVFDTVDEALGEKLTQLMFEGPIETLTLTENAQPAIMAVSIALLHLLKEKTGQSLTDLASYVAGHSLGEYSALCAAGSISLFDTAKLLRLRGQAMQKSCPAGEGAMAAVLGLDMDSVSGIAADAMKSSPGEICATANDNAPGQIVISGHKRAVEKAMALASEHGARKAILLPVSAPFHCALMQPAADAMQEALAATDLSPPAIPLVSNVTADVVNDPEQIRSLLVEQVTGQVRWRESIAFMVSQGVDNFIEVGHGKVLATMIRRIAREAGIANINNAEAIDSF